MGGSLPKFLVCSSFFIESLSKNIFEVTRSGAQKIDDFWLIFKYPSEISTNLEKSCFLRRRFFRKIEEIKGHFCTLPPFFFHQNRTNTSQRTSGSHVTWIYVLLFILTRARYQLLMFTVLLSIGGRCRSIDRDFYGPIGVTKANGTVVGFVPRFKTNIFKIVAFQAFALTVFARESDESVLRSILAVLRSENSAEEKVSDHWMDSETENIIYMSDTLPNWQNYRHGCGAKYQKEKAESTCCTFHSCHAVGFPGRNCQSCFWKCSDEKCIVGKHAQKNYYGRRN